MNAFKLLAAAFIAATAPAPLSAQLKALTIGTASAGGTVFVFGGVVASLLTAELGVPVSTQQTQGPTQNIILVSDKSVELGTGYTTALPWLTSLETPVTVLQLTGALVDRQGRAVRIGAEGILAVRTPLLASGLGAQRVLSPDDVDRARVLKDAGRPGQPLVWRAALCTLIGQLSTRSC